MTSVLRKWGNSLGLRIPKSLAEQLNVRPGTTVQITARNGQIVITPAAPTYRLDEMLKKITPKNLHRETDTGTSQGNEVW
ncbi:MAG: AbrB/MazE/SpoVT family DNA-binding domain-containing protein [Planctomycetes bacterium]|nr:AbrB/MazE/SpoVT family DNA-binding domain-containing protein [Planctomycetota bacterium]